MARRWPTLACGAGGRCRSRHPRRPGHCHIGGRERSVGGVRVGCRYRADAHRHRAVAGDEPARAGDRRLGGGLRRLPRAGARPRPPRGPADRLRRCHGAARPGGRPTHPAHRLGARRRAVVGADRLRVARGRQGPGRRPGVRAHPLRRPRPLPRRRRRVRRHGFDALRRPRRGDRVQPRRARRRSAGRRGRQVGPAAVLAVAVLGHGRADTRVRAPPLGDDGRGRRLRAGPAATGAVGGRVVRPDRGRDRPGDRARRWRGRAAAGPRQARPGRLDVGAVRADVRRHRCRLSGRSRRAPGHPGVLQGTAVPRRGRRHAGRRHRRHHPHAPRPGAAGDRRVRPRRVARPRRRASPRRGVDEGGDRRRRRREGNRARRRRRTRGGAERRLRHPAAPPCLRAGWPRRGTGTDERRDRCRRGPRDRHRWAERAVATGQRRAARGDHRRAHRRGIPRPDGHRDRCGHRRLPRWARPRPPACRSSRGAGGLARAPGRHPLARGRPRPRHRSGSGRLRRPDHRRRRARRRLAG